MTLMEYSACYRGHKNNAKTERDRLITLAWMTANFANAAIAGKLKPLERYIPDLDKKTAPQISKEEFEKKLAKAKEANKGGTGSS